MHKAVILLVKAENKESAIKESENFLEAYGEGRVWDWYAIGGRWSNTLAPKHKEFQVKAEEILKKDNKEFISTKDVNDNKELLQKIWKDLGMKDANPYSDHYKLPHEGSYYDVMPLKECLSIVKEWQQDPIAEGLKQMEEAKRWLKPKNKIDDYNMYGYSIKIAGEIFGQDFSFECNLFNTESYDFSIPEDVENYFAIMIDMHN